MGRIVVGESGDPVECLMIEKPDTVIHIYERKILAGMIGPTIDELMHWFESKYPHLKTCKDNAILNGYKFATY